jgi:hypothetical protein
MDSAKYKQQTSRADAFHRGTLTETITVLERTNTGLALRVRGELERSPIPKPERHDGGPESDIFRVELLLTEVEAVVEALGAAEAGAVAADGSTTREASRFATLLDTWLRYRNQVHEKRAA